MKLVKNGYEGLYIAISNKVPEDWSLVGKLIWLLHAFSRTLFDKTQKNLYLRKVSIVVPENWNPLPEKPEYERNEYYMSARGLWAANWNSTWNKRMYKSAPNFENTPMRVYHSDDFGENEPPRAVKGTPCGEAGRYMHFSSGFFSQNAAFGETTKFETRRSMHHAASKFFFEWAKFKWGVFDSLQQQVCKKFKEEKVTESYVR